jgi:BASS family bile acid:Na+ symporter
VRVAALVDDYLLAWVLLAVAIGLLVPAVAVVTRASTLVLAIMVGSVSLTLTTDRFRSVNRRGLAVVALGHVLMPALGYGLARLLGLSPALVAGFVVLGAVTPELVTPTMTELAGGDTALASTALVGIGVGSTAFVPAAVSLLLGADVGVDVRAIVEQLLLAVVFPMGVAIGVRHRYEARVARYEALYPTVSAVMVVLIIGGVAGANAGVVRSNAGLLAVVGGGAVALDGIGYALGWLGSNGTDRRTRIAVTLSVGMRDFAVAAALIIAAGFPPVASLPAVVFGVVEMASSAGLARAFGRQSN